MSYALTLSSAEFYDAPLSALGAETISPECQKAADAFMKVAIAVGLTSDAVKTTVEKCCQQFQKSKKSPEDRAKDMAECFVRAGAGIGGAAACTAVGAGAVAGICATVATWVTDRVLGYSPVQLGVGIAAGVFCSAVSGGTLGPACFFIGAELGEWIGDTIGPLVEDIFDPDAEERRKRQQRDAMHAVWTKAFKGLLEAQDHIGDAWKTAVAQIWDLYDKSFITRQEQSAAAADLGLGSSYGSIAMALARAGALVTVMPSAELAKHKEGTWAACEAFGRIKNGSYGPLSPICPPDVFNQFLNDPRAQGNAKQIAQAALEMGDQVNEFFLRLQIALAYLVTKITAYSVSKKAAELAAAQKNIDTFLSGAQKAAARAQAAAIIAHIGTLAASDAAVIKATAAAVTADNAAKSMLAAAIASGEKPGDRGTKAMDAVKRAKASAELAKKYNAERHRDRVLVGAALAAAVAGGAYLLLRSRS